MPGRAPRRRGPAGGGCRRLGSGQFRRRHPQHIERERGFREAATAAGIDWAEERFGSTGYRTGCDLGMALLSRSDRPDGIFCTTDLLACGVMDTARWRLGIRVPDQLSLIGFDDIAQADWDSCRPDHLSQPVDGWRRKASPGCLPSRMAAATAVTAAMKAKGARHRRGLFTPRLVMRKSVAQGFV